MRKLVMMLTVVFMVSCVNFVNAQTKEEMEASQARYEKLVKLCEKKPKSTSVSEVDVYVKKVYDAAILSMATAEQLQNLYYRQIGETKDGVTDVTVKRPTVEELTALSATIAAQSVTVKGASDSAEAALSASKNQKNPMKAAKVATALGFTKDVYPILVEELAAQTKAIAEMIETAKTANNL